MWKSEHFYHVFKNRNGITRYQTILSVGDGWHEYEALKSLEIDARFNNVALQVVKLVQKPPSVVDVMQQLNTLIPLRLTVFQDARKSDAPVFGAKKWCPLINGFKTVYYQPGPC